MNIKNVLIYLGMIGISLAFSSCHSQSPTDAGAVSARTITPVTVTHIHQGPLVDNMILNATSAFLKKNMIKSSLTGYIDQMLVTMGQRVNAGQILFVLKTKEASALSQELRQVDSTLQFSGIIKIRASQGGFISDVFHQQGDYVQDGEQLCSIADQNSFVFLLDVPFEWDRHIRPHEPCQVILPDGRTLEASVSYKMPMVDLVSQTQRYVVKLNAAEFLPENLIAKDQITRSNVPDAITLPKSAVLTDESQTDFWVMKMINDSMAVKVPVKKGLEQGNLVQIIDPVLTSSDRILTTGNYGLPDSSLVKVE
ncbi:MAG: efflux RND transporter periplasmic adaptor subunit [Chitinophagaceae bacterium]